MSGMNSFSNVCHGLNYCGSTPREFNIGCFGRCARIFLTQKPDYVKSQRVGKILIHASIKARICNCECLSQNRKANWSAAGRSKKTSGFLKKFSQRKAIGTPAPGIVPRSNGRVGGKG